MDWAVSKLANEKADKRGTRLREVYSVRASLGIAHLHAVVSHFSIIGITNAQKLGTRPL